MAESASQQFLSERAGELFLTRDEQWAEVGDTGVPLSGLKHSVGVDLVVLRVVRALGTNGAELLQREA